MLKNRKGVIFVVFLTWSLLGRLIVTMASNGMLTRNVKRRVSVIEKKIKDLQKWSVSCGIFMQHVGLVCGDTRYTGKIKESH